MSWKGGRALVPVRCVEDGREWPSIAEAARDLGLPNQSSLQHAAVTGTSCAGLHFERVADRPMVEAAPYARVLAEAGAMRKPPTTPRRFALGVVGLDSRTATVLAKGDRRVTVETAAKVVFSCDPWLVKRVLADELAGRRRRRGER